jgi:zinc-ribbon domain
VATDARQPGREAPGTRGASLIPQVPFPIDTRLHRKAVSALAAELDTGETPQVVISGRASSAIVATDRRAFVFKAGARFGLPLGSRLKEFEYESIMRVDLRDAGDEHVVVIHAPLKISVCSSYWADRRDDPWRARNAIPVDRSAEVEVAVAELSEMLAEFHRGKIALRSARDARRRSPEAPTPDVLDRIAKLEAGAVIPPPALVPRPPSGGGAPGPVTEDCPRCGAELATGSEFCAHCGAPPSLGRSDRAPVRSRLRFR